ncbi:MAG TPA: DUF5682 family protein, partial [Gemmatimonadaceae bacterium]|nr:DUF5682 family protein [Gemmatimonadaceae bacterium]
LRRTFSTFEAPVRRQLGERAVRGGARRPAAAAAAGADGAPGFDDERAAAVLPLVRRLLGLEATA